MIKALGASHVVDYRDPEASNDLARLGPYDIILDSAGKGPEYASQIPWQYKHYVTFSSPTLKNIDANGLACGMAKNIVELVRKNLWSLTNQRGFVKWAYFVAAPQGINYLKNLVDQNKVGYLSKCMYSTMLQQSEHSFHILAGADSRKGLPV